MTERERLNQTVHRLKGLCWHEYKQDACINCAVPEIAGCKNLDYCSDTNALGLFKELPYGMIQHDSKAEWYQVRYFVEGRNTHENHYDADIGTAIVKAWIEAFTCKECGGSGEILQVDDRGTHIPCPHCNNGSTWKEEV